MVFAAALAWDSWHGGWDSRFCWGMWWRLILNPLTPGSHVDDVHVFDLMAEVGVVLLMFSVGIEFSIPDLLRVKCARFGKRPLRGKELGTKCGIQASFVQVQLTLELAENRVVNAAFIAEPERGVAFDAQELARKFDELGVIVGVDAVGGVGLTGDGGEAALVANEGILIGGGKVMGVL
jgi:hypothetical protein